MKIHFLYSIIIMNNTSQNNNMITPDKMDEFRNKILNLRQVLQIKTLKMNF